MTRLRGVFGAGGFGREIMPLVREQYPQDHIVFVEDDPAAADCNGHKVMALAEFAERPGAAVIVAVGDPAARRAIVERCASAKLDFFDLRSALSVMLEPVRIGPGSALLPWTTISTNSEIGAHFHSNFYSCVGHDCVIGDFVTFAPGVRCNGSVAIGDGAYVGTSALIRQGVRIGAGAVVGMGAVVVKDVPPRVTVIGNPARVLNR